MTKTVELWIAGAVAAVLFVCGYAFLQEHDKRIRAEIAVQASADRIAVLQQDEAAIQQTTDAKVAGLQKKAAQVKTPAQAIAAMPNVSHLPLNARTLPEFPAQVAVDAVPLFQELAACRVTDAKLDGCTALRAKDAQIITEKDSQITALKAKGSVWKRAWNIAWPVAVSFGVGYAMHR